MKRAALNEAFDEEIAVDEELRAKGLIDDNGLTAAGELRLLQLKTLKLMSDNPPEIRAERARRRSARKMRM